MINSILVPLFYRKDTQASIELMGNILRNSLNPVDLK